MTPPVEPPALPGEVWRGAVALEHEGALCAVTVEGDKARVWALWSGTWHVVGSLAEDRALVAWALAERQRAERAEKLAAAERAYRVALEAENEAHAAADELDEAAASGCDTHRADDEGEELERLHAEVQRAAEALRLAGGTP